MYFRVSSDMEIQDTRPLTTSPGSSLCLLQLSLSLCKCRLAKQSHAFCNLPEFVLRRLVICLDHMPCSSSRMLHAGSPPRTGTHETPHDGQEWPLFHLPGRASSIQDLFILPSVCTSPSFRRICESWLPDNPKRSNFSPRFLIGPGHENLKSLRRHPFMSSCNFLRS